MKIENNILINVENSDIKNGTFEIPKGVKIIGNSAFAYTSLKNITIPDSVIRIGNAAFWRCTSLQSVTIGNGVTSIDNYAFYGCKSLKNITIPDSVIRIGKCAFEGCDSVIDRRENNAETVQYFFEKPPYQA